MAVWGVKIYRNLHFGQLQENGEEIITAGFVVDFCIMAYENACSQLTPIGVIPTNEAQARPLTQLEPEQQREAWTRAVETAGYIGRGTASSDRLRANLLDFDFCKLQNKPLKA